MSILTGKLTTSSGLGGARSGGAGSTSTFGMAGQNQSIAGSTGSGIVSDFRNAAGDVKQGKVSIAVVEALVLLLVGFYIWTHAIQGGG